jgi:hypothetical protein
MAINKTFGYSYCIHCNAKLQAIKKVPDPNDETGKTLIDVVDEDKLFKMMDAHHKLCTIISKFLNDTSAFYSGNANSPD